MSSTEAKFPSSAQDISAEYLTERLSVAFGPLKVKSLSYQMIGTGKMGDNARLTIQYEQNENGAPETVIAKLPAADEQARAMAGAQGAYYTEVMFYRDLANNTSMRTPAIYASELTEDRTLFLLLMEDMSPAEPGSQLIGESLGHCQMALREAAKLAAAFYGQDELGERDYIMAGAREDGGAFGQELMIQYWPVFLDRFGAGLNAEQMSFGEQYAQNHAHFVTRFQGDKTVAHGDYRSENMLFTKDSLAIVDWQTVSESSAVTDLSYFLGGSVETDNRRSWEKQLVEEYRVELDRNGVTLSADECWNQYREFSMHGLMITVLGACFSSPGERSDQMFLAMIQRHLQHCIDVGAAEFLT